MATRGALPPGLPAKVVSVPPNMTLYVTNLPSNKFQKEDIRTALYMLFSTYGPVLDVVVLKTMKMRGQAHIVFRDIQTATQAMRSLDGFEFFGRPMKIMYAKTKSNAIAKLDGTFKIPTAAADVKVTDLQQQIFNAPVPGTASTSAPSSLPPKPPAGGDQVMTDAGNADRGTKRAREDEPEESDSDVAMEEDSDDE
ncbi:U2 small nuclear ribonucleoprotein B [Podospora conica]|nr:U2 small nuclear ribonucleoprotein B [Schizothecium conicum]